MTDKPAPVRKTAKEVALAPAPEKMVAVKVTKHGENKISTGKHIPQLGDELYARDEVFSVGETAALELEAKGFVEIQ